MSKHKKHHNNSNPFDDGTNEELNVEYIEEDDSIQETNKKEEDSSNQVSEEVSQQEDENKPAKNTEEEKKGIFDGLFKKNDDELKKVKEAYDTLNNQYLRLAADFDNYRKRQEAERESLIKYGMEQALKKMIEIADNFSRAEKSIDSIDDCDKMKEAFQALNKQFKDSLIKLGLEEIKAEGEKFDPNLHEAVMQVPTNEQPEDTVVQEMQKGYKYGEKVLRPAMVSVSVSQ